MKTKCRNFIISINHHCIAAVVASVIRSIAVVCAGSGILLLSFHSFAAAAILYVDRSNPQCSDRGQGTVQAPYCTISAAAAVAAAGDTVTVSSGNYNEQVTVAHSGTQSAPIVFTAAEDAIVNIFGRDNGFKISSRSWITINGFDISDTIKYGIYIKSSSNIIISNNHVTRSGLPIDGLNYYGMKLDSATDCLVSGNTVDYNTDSGIYLTNGSTRVTIEGNQTSFNAQQYSRAASGIDVRSPGNIIKSNITHHNEDSGITITSGANDCLVVNNLSYRNGDHGFDIRYSPGQRIIGNTVYGNLTSGINIESSSSYCTLANNITVDNGIRSPRKDGNINISLESAVGTVIDHDLMWLSEPWIMIVWADRDYMSLADLVAATGMEAHGIEAEPQWIDPPNGNFRLRADSPAIDSADSSADGADSEDIESNPRVDDETIPNTGNGPRTYDDRGAYEYQAVNIPDIDAPTVAITAPASGATVSGTITVTADASDNVGVAGVQFKLNGQPLGSEDLSSPYSVSWDTMQGANGGYTLTAVARDAAGNQGVSSAISITVNNTVDNVPPAVSITAPVSGATVSGTITVTADASDNVAVAGVQFKLGTENLGSEVVNPPYSVPWNTHQVADGGYTLTAVAHDAAGNQGVSSAVTVTVNNAVSSLTFISVADASINASSPTTNYGSLTTLLVDNSPRTKFLIRFSITGIGVRSVTNAKLRLYCVNASNRGGDFYEVADDWLEGTVTWNNAPSAGSSAIASVGPVTKKSWVEVNVTPLITGDGIYSILVSTPSNDGADYNSRERVGFEPQLVLTL